MSTWISSDTVLCLRHNEWPISFHINQLNAISHSFRICRPIVWVLERKIHFFFLFHFWFFKFSSRGSWKPSDRWRHRPTITRSHVIYRSAINHGRLPFPLSVVRPLAHNRPSSRMRPIENSAWRALILSRFSKKRNRVDAVSEILWINSGNSPHTSQMVSIDDVARRWHWKHKMNKCFSRHRHKSRAIIRN